MNPYDAPQSNPKPVKLSRRLLHHLGMISVIVSIILCVGFCVLWATSYQYPQFIFYDWIQKGPPVVSRNVYWRTDNGATFLATEKSIADSDAQGAKWLGETSLCGFQEFKFIRRPSSLKGITDGFLFTRIDERPSEVGDLIIGKLLVGAPYWFLVLMTAILPAFNVVRKRLKRT